MDKHTTQRDINASERSRLALQLRKEGWTLDEIAQQCGYQDKSGAYRAIKRELERLPVEDADNLRKLELMRLDDLYSICYKRMKDKGPKGERDPLWAVDRLLKISEQRARLMGLDISKDANIAANMVVVREVPNGYLEVPKSV